MTGIATSPLRGTQFMTRVTFETIWQTTHRRIASVLFACRAAVVYSNVSPYKSPQASLGRLS